MQQKVQKQAYQIVFWQIIGIFLLAIIAWLFAGTKSAFSVLAGGLAYGLPNLLLVWRVFRYASVQQMNQFMAAFFIGEMFKLFMSGFLFLLVVKYLPVSLLSVLTGFAGAIVLFWIVSIWRYTGQSKHETK